MKSLLKTLPVFAAAVFVGQLAAAQPEAAAVPLDVAEELPGASLRVRADTSAIGCPDAKALASAVQAMLHVQVERKTKIRLTVDLARQDHEYFAQIALEGAQTGERLLRVTGEDCSGLKDALVVTLALILDEAPEPRAAATPAAGPRLPAPSAKVPVLRDRRALAAGLGAALSEALPNDVSAALRMELEFTNGPWGTAFGAFWAPTKRVASDPGTVDLQLWGGQARLCRFFGHRGGETLVTGVCTEGVVAQLTGQGHGFTSNQRQSRPWVALGASTSLGSRVDLPVGWLVRAVVTFPLKRDSFEVEGIAGPPAYKMPALSLVLEGLLCLRIL